MECPNCKEKSLRNMESKEEQQALDCMTRHIRAFLLQSSEAVSYTHLTLPTTPYV